MTRIPTLPPQIKPIVGLQRPQWSVMIPVYNCAPYLQQALESVLQQDFGAAEMQIEVIDDASMDADVQALVHTIGKGRVQYFRQPQNVGSLRNFETAINRARGLYVHLLHGDDAVCDGYYKKMTSLFNTYPAAGAAFCRYAYIDEASQFLQHPTAEAQEDGLLQNWLSKIARRQRTQYCAIAVKRSVYEKLGSFYGVAYGEDWEMWTRLAAHFPVAYTPDVLALYRRHEASISGQSFLTGQNLRDLQWVIKTIQNYLPESDRKKAKEDAEHYYAHYAASTANRLWQTGRDREGAKAQMCEALRMYKGKKLLWRLAKLAVRMQLNIR